MCETTIYSPYALIGDNLDLVKDVCIEIDKEGIINNITY